MLHSCGKWSDSQFWNDLGSFGRGAVQNAGPLANPSSPRSSQDKTALQYKRIRYYAFVTVTVMVLSCFPLVQALGGAAGNAGSIPPHLQLLHPEQGPLCAVQAVTSCCGVIKSWWSTETEPGTLTGERYLCTLCAAHPPFLTQGLTLGGRLLFYLFCYVVGFFFKYIFQTNKQTNNSHKLP